MPDFIKSYDKLLTIFHQHGIPTEQPGFYDHPQFLEVERADPTFLNCYARFVQQRPRSFDYDAKVRNVVPRIASILHKELAAEGRTGDCVNLSMVLSRILEEQGIWNYAVKGALVLKFPKSVKPKVIYFWPIDDGTPKDGHVWVSAPPFDVIDLTLREQPYPNTKMRKLLKPFVLLDQIIPVMPTVDDIVSAECRASYRSERGAVPSDLHIRLNPILSHVFSAFPANQQSLGRVEIRYIPCAFSASEEPLEGLTNQQWNGRFGFEIYRDLIAGKV